MPMEYFEQRERALLGDRFDVLYAAPQETAERGVTVSALRSSPEQFAAKADFPLEASPFCKAAFVVHQPDDLKFRPGRHPYHHAGVFYSQEPSASSAAPLLGAFERLGSSMRSSADGGSTSGWTTARAYSRRSTYTSDAIFVSWCGLHGNDREHANENFNVAAWMTFARGSPPTTGVERGGMPTHATCATRSRCLSSNNTDSTASSRCAESPSTTNSETAGCRTARPNAQH